MSQVVSLLVLLCTICSTEWYGTILRCLFQEHLTKELKERQKNIKENDEPNRVQMGLFRDLHKLLRCKVRGGLMILPLLQGHLESGSMRSLMSHS